MQLYIQLYYKRLLSYNIKASGVVIFQLPFRTENTIKIHESETLVDCDSKNFKV